MHCSGDIRACDYSARNFKRDRLAPGYKIVVPHTCKIRSDFNPSKCLYNTNSGLSTSSVVALGSTLCYSQILFYIERRPLRIKSLYMYATLLILPLSPRWCMKASLSAWPSCSHAPRLAPTWRGQPPAPSPDLLCPVCGTSTSSPGYRSLLLSSTPDHLLWCVCVCVFGCEY